MNKRCILIITIFLTSSVVFSFTMTGGNLISYLSEMVGLGGRVFSLGGAVEITQSLGSSVLSSISSGGIYELVGGGATSVVNQAATNLSNVKVYPNPYKPGSGSKYDNSQEGEGIIFENLTSDTKVRVFNIAGELVAEFEDRDGDGRYLWDTKDIRGNKVGSGVYIYVIVNINDNSQKAKGRVVIIR